MKASIWAIMVTGLLVIGGLGYMVIDASISLTDARAQNAALSRKCDLLARLSNEGLRGRPVDGLVKPMGAGVIVKLEGSELRLDDVVLRVENGKVVKIDIDETCR